MPMNDPTSFIPGAVFVDYTSNPVSIPDDFLTTPPPVQPIHKPIFFPDADLPEYRYKTAFLIDNVLSQDECDELIKLAESSVPLKNDTQSPWKPAMIAVGDGWEVLAPGYRVGDRIVWDNKTIADRLWNRCILADGVKEKMETVGLEEMGAWKFHSLNERMRFLKYTKDEYFRAHCDGPTHLLRDGKDLLTHYTLHLYLNNSTDKPRPNSNDLVGGATTFSSRDGQRRLDVKPKAGSVLIFEHDGLRHEGADVIAGVKYTVRSDVFYEWVSSIGN